MNQVGSLKEVGKFLVFNQEELMGIGDRLGENCLRKKGWKNNKWERTCKDIKKKINMFHLCSFLSTGHPSVNAKKTVGSTIWCSITTTEPKIGI